MGVRLITVCSVCPLNKSRNRLVTRSSINFAAGVGLLRLRRPIAIRQQLICIVYSTGSTQLGR